jgi:hypothetical protein
MNLTDEHKIQIFSSALNAVIQAEATEPPGGSGIGRTTAVEKASLIAAEAIAKLQSKAWS